MVVVYPDGGLVGGCAVGRDLFLVGVVAMKCERCGGGVNICRTGNYETGVSVDLCVDCRIEGPSEMGAESLPVLLSVIRQKDAELFAARNVVFSEAIRAADEIERLRAQVETLAAGLRLIVRPPLMQHTNPCSPWIAKKALKDAGMEE
jgi:hypothetical protein